MDPMSSPKKRNKKQSKKGKQQRNTSRTRHPARKPNGQPGTTPPRGTAPKAVRDPSASGEPQSEPRPQLPEAELIEPATAGSTASEPQVLEPDVPEVSGPVSAIPVIGAADDPEATWWDELWPFKDDRGTAPVDAEPQPTPGADEVPEPVPEGPVAIPGSQADPTPPHVLALGAGPASTWRTRALRGGLVAAGLVLAASLVGGGIWLTTSGGTTSPTRLARSGTYQSPVRLAPNTSYVQTRVLPSGDLVVTHWIRSRRPVYWVRIRTPQVLGLAPGAVKVQDVTLASDGLLSSVVAQPPGLRLRTYAVPAAHTLFVRYRVSGAVERSRSAEGRALARLTALDVSIGEPLVETTQRVVGAQVLALACTPAGPRALAVPCGTVDHGSWQVRLARAHRDQQVSAQVDLS
jgi:hypothetical protein